ncbi:hypothetical protein SAMN05216196_11275 [Lutimaribacter pacificus]|uniref:Replication initiation factor n=1 Tax=Lutimaribacter pacificus TaxID=391948 RepID=A0A1H0NBV6_9RHOB|nr:hypothetical protein [Lutimaribacter pacificus]SDO89770.1 hypothetical protein SAMN05216196_11275 [Lutimaribacter pacificus]SHK84792.1 hypothetical protein SAMN05444142_1112 [Lutimaribacter pacificus]
MQHNNIKHIEAGSTTRPQNKSYPAGGVGQPSKATDGNPGATRRGGIVAPLSRNTDHPDAYQVLHKGFDTLTVAVQAQLPPEVVAYFDAQKELAEKEQQDILIDYNGVQLHMKGHGGAGYRYLANGGPMGAQWAFKKPNPKDPWGIRVIFGSAFMATLGLGAARAHLDTVLDRLGIRTRPEDFSISRVDYCVDILTAAGFILDPEAFVMHSSTNRRDHVANADMAVSGKSGRTTSVTIGSTRARQVIVYDKRAEVIQKHKAHWWLLWNQTRQNAGDPPVGPETGGLGIWRIEFRAGKDLLKDRWNIRTWEDLFTRFGDLSNETGRVIRYTEPSGHDSNRARWPNHPIWDIALGEINTDLIEMYEGTDPTPVKEVQRSHHIGILLKNIKGSTITLAALHGVEQDDLQRFFKDTAKKLSDQIDAEPERTAKQLQDARDRYVFINASGNKSASQPSR